MAALVPEEPLPARIAGIAGKDGTDCNEGQSAKCDLMSYFDDAGLEPHIQSQLTVEFPYECPRGLEPSRKPRKLPESLEKRSMLVATHEEVVVTDNHDDCVSLFDDLPPGLRLGKSRCDTEPVPPARVPERAGETIRAPGSAD